MVHDVVTLVEKLDSAAWSMCGGDWSICLNGYENWNRQWSDEGAVNPRLQPDSRNPEVEEESLRGARRRLCEIIAGACVDEPVQREDGQWVSSYIDGNRFLGDPEGLYLSVQLLLEPVLQSDATAVVGTLSAAAALVSGLVLMSRDARRSLTGRYIRKHDKPYGVGRWLSSPLPAGTATFVVDDVAATGATAEHATSVLRSLGLEVVGMMVIVDRGGGASERLRRQHVQLRSILTLEEVARARQRAL